MPWDDAKDLAEAKSRTTVDGTAHLLRVYRAVLDREQEDIAHRDLVASAVPQRAKRAEDGVQTAPPSWRFRVTTDTVVFQALLSRGDAAPAITEVEVVAHVARGTEGQRKALMDDKDDAQADWRIAAFEIELGIHKKQRVKVIDRDHARKLADWTGRTNSVVSEDGADMRPAHKVFKLTETPGFKLRIVWVDIARKEEPKRGAFKSYLEDGYYPPEFQKQRDEAFRIIKARLAKAGLGEVSDLPESVREDVLKMAAGGMSAARIATLLDLKEPAVVRIVTQAEAAPREKPEAPKEKAPRKPRAPKLPKEKAPEPGATP